MSVPLLIVSGPRCWLSRLSVPEHPEAAARATGSPEVAADRPAPRRWCAKSENGGGQFGAGDVRVAGDRRRREVGAGRAPLAAELLGQRDHERGRAVARSRRRKSMWKVARSGRRCRSGPPESRGRWRRRTRPGPGVPQKKPVTVVGLETLEPRHRIPLEHDFDRGGLASAKVLTAASVEGVESSGESARDVAAGSEQLALRGVHKEVTRR